MVYVKSIDEALKIIKSRPNRVDGFLGKLDLRPMERLLWNRVIYDKKNAPLRWGRLVTKYVRDEIVWGLDNESHLLVNIFGLQGSGKSMLALKIWKILQREWAKRGKKVELYITFSLAETREVFPKLKPGDVIIQDEDPNLSGVGAKSVIDAVNNLQAMMRARQISWLFLYPKPIYNLVNPTLVLEVVGYNKELKRTLAVVYNRMYSVEGWAWFDLSEVFADKELLEYYRGLKEKNLDKAQKTGGFISAGLSQEEIEEWIVKVVELWRTKYSHLKVKSLSDVDMFLELLGYSGPEHQRRMLRKIIFHEIQTQLRDASVVDEVLEKTAKQIEQTSKSRVGEEELGTDVAVYAESEEKKKVLRELALSMDFRHWLWEYIKDMERPPPQYKKFTEAKWRNFKKLIQITVEMWDQNIVGRQMDTLILKEAAGFKTHLVITEATRAAGETGFLGDAFEKFWWESKGMEWPGRAGIDEPDWVDPKTGDVWSLKTSAKQTNTMEFNVLSECKPELLYAREHGKKKIFIAFANPFWSRHPFIVEYPFDFIKENRVIVSFKHTGEVRIKEPRKKKKKSNLRAKSKLDPSLFVE